MALQPEDEPNNLYALRENTWTETSQYTSLNPVATVSFSPITNVFRNQSSTPFPSNSCPLSSGEGNLFFSKPMDSNSTEDYLRITSDIADKVEEMMNTEKIGLEDLPCNWLINELNMMELKTIDKSIKDRLMEIETQPPSNIRRRYQSDGKRQIEKSRSKPMAIKLPDLKHCKLHPHQSFWIQLILITYNKNPANKVHIHVDKLEYHADDLPTCDHGFVRVPLTQQDIEEGMKQLARISIIKAKLDTYTFQLLPLNPSSTNTSVEIYENQTAKSTVAKAKSFRDLYNLESSRISCQLLIKQNETWHTTDIVCETSIMKEGKEHNPKKSNKQPTSSEIQTHRRSSGKKRKRSPSSMKPLPVTRVKRT